MRIIDADLLECDTEWSDYEDGFTAYSRMQIECAPSIDIVRCKECKYAEVSVSPITGLWCTRFGINDMAMEDDDYCSYGEREGE